MKLLKQSPGTLVAVIFTLFMVGPALAQDSRHKPAHAGQQTSSEMRSDEKPAESHAKSEIFIGKYFSDQQRDAVRHYFAQHYLHAKECLPGLSKKSKGCGSPWDTRYWAVGQPVPPSVEVYPVPEPMIAQLSPPPDGYRYVRIADDIALVATGNNLIVDLITNVLG